MFNLNEECVFFCNPKDSEKILSRTRSEEESDIVLSGMMVSMIIPEGKVILVEEEDFLNWLNENGIVLVKGE